MRSSLINLILRFHLSLQRSHFLFFLSLFPFRSRIFCIRWVAPHVYRVTSAAYPFRFPFFFLFGNLDTRWMPKFGHSFPIEYFMKYSPSSKCIYALIVHRFPNFKPFFFSLVKSEFYHAWQLTVCLSVHNAPSKKKGKNVPKWICFIFVGKNPYRKWQLEIISSPLRSSRTTTTSADSIPSPSMKYRICTYSLCHSVLCYHAPAPSNNVV